MKMDINKYNFIKNKYGLHASWAVWAEEADKPKSNMGDLSVFDDENILQELNPNIVLVALNFSVSGVVQKPFQNFLNLKKLNYYNHELYLVE